MFKKLLTISMVFFALKSLAVVPFVAPKFQKPSNTNGPRIKVSCPTRPPSPKK